MRTIRLLPLVLALAAGCGKGVSSFTDAADQGVEAMNDYASILASVKDKSSAEAARPKLEAVAKRMGEIVEAMKTLDGPPDDAEAEKSDEKVRTAMQGVSTQVSAYMDRSRSNPEIAAPLRESFGAVSKQLMPLRAMLGA
jgi:head-tail adaptor